jgi:hypothetical protein
MHTSPKATLRLVLNAGLLQGGMPFPTSNQTAMELDGLIDLVTARAGLDSGLHTRIHTRRPLWGWLRASHTIRSSSVIPSTWIGRDEFRRMVHRPLRLLRRLRPLYAPSLTLGYSHAMFSSTVGRRGSLVFSPALLTGEGVTSLWGRDSLLS